MNRRTFLRCAGAAGMGWGLAGCAGMGFYEPLNVTLVGIDPLPGEGMEFRMAVKLRLQNPNDSQVDFDGVSLALDLRDTTFASGVSDERGSVPRFGETVISVPVSVSAFAAVRSVIGMFTAKEKQATEYALRGQLSGSGFGGTSFESRGVIDVSELMRSK